MDITTPLFEGDRIRLAPIDREKDAEIESRWTHDPVYLRMLDAGVARPLSLAQLEKRYEKIEKEAEESKSSFYFTIRTRVDDRLVGFVRLYWIEWSMGASMMRLGIGGPGDRNQGYGKEALALIKRYVFAELNLYRLSASVPGYNTGAIRFFERAGFSVEARQRQALHRDGKRWDWVLMGQLRPEWEAALKQAE